MAGSSELSAVRELFSFLRLLFVRLPAVVWWTFWYWLRARDILVPVEHIVLLGRVESRRGNVWTVRVASHLTTAMLVQLAVADDLIHKLVFDPIDVRIDQRGTAWAVPGGPEENAFRTIVALTENN